MENRLYRSRTDRMIFGVCGGLGKYLGIDPTIIRILFVLLTFAGGVGVIAYIIMAFIVPVESSEKTTPQSIVEENVKEIADTATKLGTGLRDTFAGKGKESEEMAKIQARRRNTLGIIVIVVGVVCLLGALNIFNWFNWWGIVGSLILVAIGVVLIMSLGRRKPMSEDKPCIVGAVPIGGILVLFTGIVLLLQVTGVLHWDLWGALWKFWPVVIIIFGLGILLQRVNVWLVSLLTLAVLGVCLAIAVWQTSPTLSGDLRRVGENYSVPSANIESINAEIEISAGSLIIQYLQGNDTGNLFEAIATHDGGKYLNSEQRTTMLYDFAQSGTTGNLSLKPANQQNWNKWDVGWRVAFNPGVSTSLDVHCDAAYMAFDLRDLKVNELRLEMNAGNGHIHLPSAGTGTINIDMDVSNLEIRVPEGLAVKIQVENNLSILEIDNNRFSKQGDYYISPGYDSAENRVLMNILCDVGRVIVK